MLGGADNPNGELPSYITGADSTDASTIQSHFVQAFYPFCAVHFQDALTSSSCSTRTSP